MDEFTEVSNEGWGGRLMSSIKGIVFGLAMFIGAFPLTWWNEGRAITQTRSLEEGAGALVQATTERVDPAREGKLIYLSGSVEATGPLADPDFGISADVLGLKRKVEMFQWHEDKKTETRKKVGGGKETTTTYSYKQSWDDDLVESSRFHNSEGHVNPNSMPMDSRRLDAQSAKLGAYTLDQGIIQKLEHWQSLQPGVDAAASGLELHGDTFYSADPAAAKVGDIRVSFEQVLPGPFSFVARQTGTGLDAYPTQAGNPILLIETGTQTSKQMFAAAHSKNTFLTWLLRAAGFALMTFGLSLVLRPLSTVLDVIPLLGNVAEMGILVVCALLALVFSSVTIAVAWLWFRPLIGVAMLVAAVAGLFLLKQRKGAVPARAMPPPVPAPMAMPPPPPPG